MVTSYNDINSSIIAVPQYVLRTLTQARTLLPSFYLSDCFQVQHAKRTIALPTLPPYAPELVRSITREIRELNTSYEPLFTAISSGSENSPAPATITTMFIDNLCMRRNKRCLLAYHRVRSTRLESEIWEGRDVLEENGDEAEAESASLSPEEEEYVQEYTELVASLKGQWEDIDLGGSLIPPRELFVDVRVLKDAGEIQTEYG